MPVSFRRLREFPSDFQILATLSPLCCLQLPGDVKLAYFDAESNMQEISVEQLTKGKKVGMREHLIPSALLCPSLVA